MPKRELMTPNCDKRLVRREDIVVTTKVGYGTREGINASGHSRKHIMDSIDASLGRLGMDHVDLYMLHFFDLNTPVGETMEALHDIVNPGVEGVGRCWRELPGHEQALSVLYRQLWL